MYQIITLYTLNLHVLCPLYLHKTGNMQIHRNRKKKPMLFGECLPGALPSTRSWQVFSPVFTTAQSSRCHCTHFINEEEASSLEQGSSELLLRDTSHQIARLLPLQEHHWLHPRILCKIRAAKRPPIKLKHGREAVRIRGMPLLWLGEGTDITRSGWLCIRVHLRLTLSSNPS